MLWGLGKATYRSGNPAFWHTVSRYPDQAYDWFLGEPCWLVLHSWDRQPDTHGLAGPFLLAIPKLGGQTVRVYGRLPEIEDSEERFLLQISP